MTNNDMEDISMEQINNTNRCCATCTYWLGYRNPNRLGYVEVGCRMDHGQCSAHNLTEHFSRQATYSCSNYCKWSVLK